MFLLSKIIIIILIVIVKKAELKKYDDQILKSLGYSLKTLKQINIAGCSKTERCVKQKKEDKEEMRGPINDMRANAGFDGPNTIFRDTNKLMIDLAKEGSMLAKDSDDNDDELKYVFSLMQYFHLRFIKIYIKLQPTENPKILYNKAFDLALVKAKDYRIWDALQLAAPVRRVQYVLASVIDKLIEIVQAACSKYSLDWQCGARYYITLAKETNRCPNLWHNHHKVFAEALKLVQKNQKTLLDVTKDVMATVDYMTSRRFVFDYENQYFNRRDVNYDDYDYLHNDYDNLIPDHLGELNDEYNKANPLKYAKSFQEYYDLLDGRRSISNLNAGSDKNVDNLMPFYDFRTETGTKLNRKNYDYVENKAEYMKSDESVTDEADKMISVHYDETEEKHLQEELKRKNISDVHLDLNSIIIDRNTFENRQSENTVKKRDASENKLSDVDVTINKNLNLLQEKSDIDDNVENDYDYESFYDDIERRNLIFDSSLKILNLYRNVLKDSLIKKAELYKLVHTYQKQNKLSCILIDNGLAK